MTPQEQALISELFDRLASLENNPRDAEAERAIADGLRRAPHAAYALVQTALVQDEALKRANARIEELEAQFGGEQEQHQGSFLELDARGRARQARAARLGAERALASNADIANGAPASGSAADGAAALWPTAVWRCPRLLSANAWRSSALCLGRIVSRHSSLDGGRRGRRRASHGWDPLDVRPSRRSRHLHAERIRWA